jgi:hypothetical protein
VAKRGLATAVALVRAAFTVDQRRVLADALADGRTPDCPSCGGPVVVRPVEPPSTVSYVRHRVLVLCAACHRSAAVDVPAADARDRPEESAG